MEELGLEQNCLICCAKGVGVILRSPTLGSTWVPGNGDGGACLQGEGTILNGEIQVMLLLRKVLRLRKSFLGSLLQNGGGGEEGGENPSSWDLKLCQLCFRIYEEAMFIWGRLNKLQGEFQEVSKLLRGKMLQAVEDQGNGHQALERGCETTRDNVSPKKRKPGRPPKKKRGRLEDRSSYHHLEEDGSVAGRIRSEFVGLHRGKDNFGGGGEDDVPKTTTSARLRISTDRKPESCWQVTETDPNHSLITGRKKTEIEVIKGPVQISADADADEYAPDQFFQDLLNDVAITTVSGQSFGIGESDINEDISNNPSPVPEGEWPEISNDCQGMENDIDMELPEPGSESAHGDTDDSDFEPPTRRRTVRNKRISRAARRRKCISAKDPGAIVRAIKMETPGSYQCSKCRETFSSSLQCDEHILHEHYGGTWPQMSTCPFCGNRFKGETWLRQHLKVRHPEYKLPIDEVLQRGIMEGSIPEITYDTIPLGESLLDSQSSPGAIEEIETTHVKRLLNSSVVRTVEDPPEDTFSVPMMERKKGGQEQIRYLVPPDTFSRLIPEGVLSQLRRGPVDKKCEHCNWRLPTEIQYKAHVQKIHKREKMCYDCPICPKKFKWFKLLLVHLQKTHVEGKFVCEKCGQMFREEVLLRAHVQRVHLGINNPFECLKCGPKYRNRGTLNSHMKKMHKLQVVKPVRLLTAYAKGQITRRQSAKKRSRRSTGRKNIPCEICQKKNGLSIKFATDEDLDVHVKQKHMGIARPYPCPVCGKKYSSPRMVDRHLQTHTVRNDMEVGYESVASNGPFHCHPCNKSYPTKPRLEDHLKGRNHKYIRPFVCELCSESFMKARYLENHQYLKHHEELGRQPFRCKFCDKILGSQRTLDAHIVTSHTKDSKYKCPHCDVCFVGQKAMQNHIDGVHTKSANFLCTMCPKSFSQSYNLTSHMRVHTGEKPYECKFCSKKFSDRPTYNRHVEAHSNVDHSCSYCDKTGFKTRHSLRVHMKTFHKDIVDRLDKEAKLKRLVPSASRESDSMDGTIVQ